MTKESTRIYIGAISKTLADNIQDLETRFARFGEIEKPFEIHCKNILNYHYAYTTLKLTKEDFKKLKKAFHGANFKGSQLIVDLAKPDYKQNWVKDSKRQDDKIKQRERRQKIADRRIERISQRGVNPFVQASVIKGRVRKNARKANLSKLTLRVNFKGTIKIIRCRKTKVWGYNKNKKLRDLVYRFIHGEWRDGNDHILERLTKRIIIFDNDGVKVLESSGEEEEEQINEEQEKLNEVLGSLLSKYNFDKPVELQTRDEEYAGAEYEFEGGNNKSDDEDEVMDIDYDASKKDCIVPSYDSIVKGYKQGKDQFKMVHYDEEEEEEEDEDFYKNLTRELPQNNEEIIAVKSSTTHDGQVDADLDDEFIPGSAAKTTGPEKQSSTTINETEKLRSLLNPVEEQSSSFHFQLDDSDIDESQNVAPEATTITTEEQVEEQSQEPAAIPEIKKKFGLFFANFDSPFLIAQTQINKLNDFKINEKLKYDDWFWENRGELNREFRGRRRDVLRQIKKKNKGSASGGNTFMI